ncbi:hypothetical protein BJP34_16270 [Moorena producens PAL-8-15-08-1]|uniref:Uncharacterized protein n=1 Tax=Moorena producens PAL-8-15-08-1 TaxID=1458985 RepID=A0A1D8TT04_9CYAN|nr:hypothetical protein [Moorena producens]AOX00791.1 hypothetical protein BJP34_16270 [Moorena producens PAL-8-15-08-1]
MGALKLLQRCSKGTGGFPHERLHQDIVVILRSIGGRIGGVVAIGLVKEIVAIGLVGAIKLLHCRHEVVAVGVVG